MANDKVFIEEILEVGCWVSEIGSESFALQQVELFDWIIESFEWMQVDINIILFAMSSEIFLRMKSFVGMNGII